MRTSACVRSACLLLLLSSSLLPLAACGGGTPDSSAAVAPVASAFDAGAATTLDAAAAARTASPDLQAHWPFTAATAPRDATMYIDLDGALRTELVRDHLLPVLVPLIATQAPPEALGCEKALASHARELAIASLDDGIFSVLRVDSDSAPATLAACVALSKQKLTAATVSGADEAWSLDDGDVTARRGGIIASGPKELVAASIAGSVGSRGSSAWPAADLGLATDQYAAAVFDRGPVRGHLALVANKAKFRIAIDAQVADEATAKLLETKLLEKKHATSDDDVPADTRATLDTIKRALRIERDGTKLAVAMDLDETPAAQASDLFHFAAYGVQTYIANAKASEARATLGEIAKSYAIYEEKVLETTPKRKLISLPAVPKTVPRGVPYQSSAKEWKPWSVIGFSRIEPQYYQYEVKAAKDGASVDIIARGDLNGDGKTSTFTVRLTVDPTNKAIRVSDAIDEVDPAQ